MSPNTWQILQTELIYKQGIWLLTEHQFPHQREEVWWILWQPSPITPFQGQASKLFNFPSHRCVCLQQAVTCLHPDSTGNKLSARNLGYLERSKEQERTRLNVERKGPLPRAHSSLCVSPAHRLLQTRRLGQDLHKAEPLGQVLDFTHCKETQSTKPQASNTLYHSLLCPSLQALLRIGTFI